MLECLNIVRLNTRQGSHGSLKPLKSMEFILAP